MRRPLRLYVALGVIVVAGVLPGNAVFASEPGKLDAIDLRTAKQQILISKISKYSSSDTYNALTSSEFLADEELMDKAVSETFGKRREEALSLALWNLSLPLKEVRDGRSVHRARELYVARKIVEAFPNEATPLLLDLFERGDATTKGNVIRVSGRLSGEPARSLLLRALSDKTFGDPPDPEVDGPPMRICDLAYNQLVLRYRIRNVLRTIGPTDRIETRDLHIANLRGRL